MRTARVIVIDPIAKTAELREAQPVGEGWDEINKLLGVQHSARPVSLGSGIYVFIDDDGSFYDWDKKGVFQLGTTPYFGVGVIARMNESDDSGDVASLPLGFTIEQHVRPWLSFPDPSTVRMGSTTIETMDAEGRVTGFTDLGPAMTYERSKGM